LVDGIVDSVVNVNQLMDELTDSVHIRREGQTTASPPRGPGTEPFRMMWW